MKAALHLGAICAVAPAAAASCSTSSAATALASGNGTVRGYAVGWSSVVFIVDSFVSVCRWVVGGSGRVEGDGPGAHPSAIAVTVISPAPVGRTIASARPSKVVCVADVNGLGGHRIAAAERLEHGGSVDGDRDRAVDGVRGIPFPSVRASST